MYNKVAQKKYFSSPNGREARWRYEDSHEGQAVRARYAASHEGKATAAQYAASPEGKAAKARYTASPKGKATTAKVQARYRASPKGQAAHSRLNAARRSRILALEVDDLTGNQWCQILEAHNFQCHYCSSSITPLTMDHIVPISKGGQHTASNIVPACRSCNSRKGAKV